MGTEIIELDPDQLIEITFTPSAWEFEVSFELYNPDGTLLISGDGFEPEEELVFQGMVECPGTGFEFELSWVQEDILSFSEDSLSASVIPGFSTIYEVQLANDEGCVVSENVLVEVSSMIHTDSVTTSDCAANNGEIFITSLGGIGQYIYSIIDSSGFNFSGIFQDLMPGEYSVQVSDQALCTSLLDYEITEETCALDVFIPNVFTPNNDNSNDAFVIELEGGEDPSMSIYNRWGRLVFETSDVSKGWNGEIDSSQASEGTYYYVFHVTEEFTQEMKVFKGSLSLFR